MDKLIRELALMVNKNEKILWSSKPDKICFLLESFFNPLLPVALIWLLFDSFVFLWYLQQKILVKH